MANLIYGINARRGLTEINQVDRALRTLGLDPADLSHVGNISNKITRSQFHHLSYSSGSPKNQFPENAIQRISKYGDAIRGITNKIENKAGASINSSTGLDSTSVKGNIVVNGSIAAPAIRYFSTDNLNSQTGVFDPLDISTSRVSSWSRQGNTLSFGGSLKIDNISPAVGHKRITALETEIGTSYQVGLPPNTPGISIGKIIIDARMGKTTITPRTFKAEQATHKLKLKINGIDTYVYAMKNIPLSFEGTFAGSRSKAIMSVTATGIATDYRVFQGTNFQNIPTSNSALNFEDTSEARRIIEVYQVPSKITTIVAENLKLENFPNADYTNLTSLKFNGNLLTSVPNFTQSAPNLTTLELNNNKFYESPIGSDADLNRISATTLSRFPAALTTLKISHAFGRGPNAGSRSVNASFKDRFLSLHTFHIGDSINSAALSSPMLPEIPTSCREYKHNYMDFSMIPGASQSKQIRLGFDENTSVHSIIGTPTKPAQIKITRSQNQFCVNFSPRMSKSNCSPGAGYNNGTHTFTTKGLTYSGASSPQGIVDGNLTLTIANNKIEGATFAPVMTPAEFNLKPQTFPKYPNGFQETKIPHVKDSGYSPMGFYIDCGLFSSPCSRKTFTGVHQHYRVFSLDDGYMNQFALSSANGTRNRKKYNVVDFSNVARDTSDVYKKTSGTQELEAISCGHSYMPIPFLVGNTTFNRFDLNHNRIPNYDDVTHDIRRAKVKLKTHPGLDTPSKYNFAQMYTLYDSPHKDSPSDGSNVAVSSLGATGIYKLSGCSDLSYISLQSGEFFGTFPAFTGNDKLEYAYFGKTRFTRFEPGPVDGSPVNMNINQFFDCRNKLKEFIFTRGSTKSMANRYGSNIGPTRTVKKGGNTYTVAQGIRSLEMQRIRAVDTAHTNITGIEPGDFPTDVLGPQLDRFILATREQNDNREWRSRIQEAWGWPGDNSTRYNGITGPIPTFKLASGLTYLKLSGNSFGGPYAIDNFTIGYNPNLEELQISNNAIGGNFSLHNLLNETAGTTKGSDKLKKVKADWNMMKGLTDLGYQNDDPMPEFLQLSLADAFDCPSFSRQGTVNSAIPYGKGSQQLMEPGSASGSSDRWLLDRRKDGTAYKYEQAVPELFQRFPKLRHLQLSNWDMKASRGIFTRFEMSGNYDYFFNTNIGFIDIRGNGFTKSAIVDLAEALKRYCLNERNYRSRVTVKCNWQRGYDSPSGSDPLAGTGVPGLDGNMDFRLRVPGDNILTFHPDSVYRSGDPRTHLYDLPTLEQNDLFEELRRDYDIKFEGVLHSVVPQAPQAPTNIDLNITGYSANKLHPDRQSGNTYNLYETGGGNNTTFSSSQLDMEISISGIDRGATTSLKVFKTNWQGIKTELTQFRTEPQPGAYLGNPTVFNYTMPIIGTGGDINRLWTLAPNNLSDALPEGTTDFSQHSQTFTISVEVSGVRPGVAQTEKTLTFINNAVSATYPTTDGTSHVYGEWKDESIS